MENGSWLCEPAVWLQDWQTRGELYAIRNSSLLLLESKTFVNLIRQFPVLFFDMASHARWALEQLKLVHDELTDLWRPDSKQKLSIFSLESCLQDWDTEESTSTTEEMKDDSGDAA